MAFGEKYNWLGKIIFGLLLLISVWGGVDLVPL
jgi:hypothetical protein